MGGGARALLRQPKTAVFFLRKLPKPGGSKSVNGAYVLVVSDQSISWLLNA